MLNLFHLLLSCSLQYFYFLFLLQEITSTNYFMNPAYISHVRQIVLPLHRVMQCKVVNEMEKRGPRLAYYLLFWYHSFSGKDLHQAESKALLMLRMKKGFATSIAPDSRFDTSLLKLIREKSRYISLLIVFNTLSSVCL